MKLLGFITLLFIIFPLNTNAQSASDWLFDDTSLPSVYITIDPGDLNRILTNVQSDIEYPATFVFKREDVADTVENIGFRIRGNTSRYSDKKSFKVSFDTFIDGREYRGLDKMNINGEHNDPSIIRSKLSWDIFEALEVPAPRSNHVRLYINDDYFGLYMNVEHIDNEFVEDRFGSDAGNLYKSLWPASLTYLGENPNDYKQESNGRRTYELKTNEDEDDYTDIANFIKLLERSSDEDFENEIRDYINVDGVIRVMAVDIITGMWDDYMFNKNNFYLYQNPATNRFEFIPFDYDNTFGIDWFGITWAVRDFNNWGTNESRPLTDRLFAIPKYRDRLNYYIEKLLDEHFNNVVMVPEIDRLKAMIQQAAEEDTYRTLDYGYTIDDFNRSYEFALDGHVKSGIKGYLSNRHNTARTQLLDYDITPVILESDIELTYTNTGANLTVTAKAFDDNTFSINAHFEGTESSILEMKDDGQNGDIVSGDGIYTTVLSIDENVESIQIYVEATDDQNQTDRFPYNSEIFMEVEFSNSSDNLLINEFMASNNSTIQDEFGAFEDWVEIYNPTSSPVSMLGYYLTDDIENPTKWAFPDTTIEAQNYLLVWTDNDDEEGPLHTSFRLSRSGEDLGIFYFDNSDIQTIDAFSYGEQTTDVSYGRQVDGSTSFVFFDNPTPGGSNGSDTSNEIIEFEVPATIELFQNYPNPFNPSTVISYQLLENSFITLSVFDALGREVRVLENGLKSAGSYSFTFDASSLSNGVYFYRLETATGEIQTRKMTLLK
jgi:hypothetical protein